VIVTAGDWNHEPVIELPEDGFTVAEDSSVDIDFSPFISDPDGDALIITSVPIPEIDVQIAGNIVTLTPEINYNGTETISFAVIDNIGRLITMDEVSVTVTPRNDAPTIVLPAELSLSVNFMRQEDFSLFINDIDPDDNSTLTFSGNENIDISANGLLVNFISDWVGSEMITFTVQDDSMLTASDSVIVIVYAGQANNDPIITLPEFISFDEDGILAVDFNEYIGDADDDELSLLVTGNSFISVSISPNEIVTFTAMNDWFGNENLTFIVSLATFLDLILDLTDLFFFFKKSNIIITPL
jgi:hypothetical protein